MKALWSLLVLGMAGALYPLLSVGNAPPQSASPEEAAILKEVKVPPEFEVTLFARPPLVSYPVAVAAAPNGDLYVSSDKNGSLDRKPHRGSIIRLRDRDGDGKADEAKPFIADVDTPRGLVWDHDRLYLMHPPHLSAFIDHDGDGVADEEKVLVKNIAFTFKDRPGDHTSNGVTLGIDGWLYLAIGDFGFMQAEGTDGTKLQFRGGGVVRVRPDGTDLEVYDRHTRNSLEVALSPLLDAFTRDNTNDGGGWDTRLQQHTALAEHGYPSLFQHFADEIVAPLADYGGGAGVGTLYLQEPGFPRGYGDALYTADWGRSWVYRHRLTPQGATFQVDQKQFLGVPRVTDLDVDALSRLYVSSWKGATFTYNGENVGYVVRVAPRGYQPEPLPNFARATDAALVKLLESPSHRRRLEAQRTLLRRGLTAATVKALESLAADMGKPLETRVAAVFALKQGLHERSTGFLSRLAAEASIREFALRALTDRKGELAGVPAPPLLTGLKDASARVRRQAAESIARLGKQEHAAALAPLLADADPRVAHTAVQALMALKAADVCFAVVDRVDAPVAERVGGLRVLQSLHRTGVVDGLIRRFQQEGDAARRRGLFTALCRLYYEEGPWKGNGWGTRPDTSGPYYQPETWAASAKVAAVLKAAVDQVTPAEAPFLFGELDRHKVQLEGSLDRLIALAAKDATLLPALVGPLARGRTVPAKAVDLLLRAATAEDTLPAVRSQAVLALAKTDRPDSVRAMLTALAHLEKTAGRQAAFDRARDAFLNSARLDRQVPLLQNKAGKLNDSTSPWADAALLTLSTRKTAGANVQAAVQALEAGWAEPKRRIQILRAVALARHRESQGKVLAAAKDPDPQVAATAKRTVSDMHFDKRMQFTGPKIGTLKVEAVLKEVVRQKGDPVLGEQLFTQLTCTKCHTVKQGDPLIGPYLGNIATTYKRRELAEAVLLPSKTIAQGFNTNVILLDNGKVVTGFVVKEAADKVTLRDAESREIVIAVARIEERSTSPISMMPEGLVRDLTVGEFASLLDYLEALAPKK